MAWVDFVWVENGYNFGWISAGGKQLGGFWPDGFRLQAVRFLLELDKVQALFGPPPLTPNHVLWVGSKMGLLRFRLAQIWLAQKYSNLGLLKNGFTQIWTTQKCLAQKQSVIASSLVQAGRQRTWGQRVYPRCSLVRLRWVRNLQINI